MKNAWLNEYAKNNTYSQFGEDGIIAKALEMLPNKNHWCVEFGAWDGKYLSTTLLLRENGYSAVLIEGDQQKFKELKEICEKETNSIPVNCFVEPRGEHSLDSILEKTAIPIDFDLLVIDIDGNDYHVWKGVERYRPKIVCIECNPSFPDDAIFIQSESEDNQGSSMMAMVELAKEKGYELIATLGGNTFFVDQEFFSIYNIEDNSLHNLRGWYGSIMYVSQTYKGEIYTYGAKQLIWSNNELINQEIRQFERLCKKLLGVHGRRERLYLFLTRLRNKVIGL